MFGFSPRPRGGWFFAHARELTVLGDKFTDGRMRCSVGEGPHIGRDSGDSDSSRGRVGSAVGSCL
eukprot:8935082-Pyramimonas_sp.AAC.1